MNRQPPKLVTTLLKRLSNNDALEGDLREAYESGKSEWWYWKQAIAAVACRESGRPRAVSASITVTLVAVVVLDLPFLSFIKSVATIHQVATIVFLLLQALPIAIPVGITIGILGGLPTVPERPSRRIVVVVALSVAICFVFSGWVVPASNQAFRVAVKGSVVSRGFPELTLAEERAALVDNKVPFNAELATRTDPWDAALNYYGRLAITAAPVAFMMFVLAVGHSRQRLRLAVIVGFAYVAFFVIDIHLRALPPGMVAWGPNAALIGLSFTTASLRCLRAA